MRCQRDVRRIDPFDLGVLVAFAAVSMWVVGLDLWQVVAHGRVWTGTDGLYVVDQLQYIAWIKDASRHGLVANLFVLRPTPVDYLQPAVTISGGLAAVGVAPWLALLMWKPVAVAGCFFAFRAFVRSSLSGTWNRRAALVLALFFGSFTIVYGSWSVLGDLFPGFLSWGYTFGLLALAAMVGALLSYGRHWGEERLVWLPGLLGCLASWLHPWNGELLIAVLIGTELVCGRGQWTASRLGRLAVTVVLTAAPLAYYGLLGRTDLSWRLARVASKHSFPLWAIALGIAPLLLPALLGYRERPRSFLAATTRVWPGAAFVVYALSASGLSATPLHAFQGITLPLSVLAVEGIAQVSWDRIPHRRVLGGLLVAAFTIPAVADELRIARRLVAPRLGTANFITRDERRALDYLDRDSEPGGVLARSYLGALVPGATGRRSYVGDCLWSQPYCDARLVAVRSLFGGSLTPPVARAFVRSSGARFLLADCRPNADLETLLRPVIRSVRHFGCATVYAVAPPRPAPTTGGYSPVGEATRGS